jgi:phytoene dehydrogenase-like protein
MSEVIYDVAIVGGGLAGINAALRFSEEGKSVLLIEAADRLGGKLRTDVDEDGFVYDHGFQVVFPTYEEIPTEFWKMLGTVPKFSKGAVIAGKGLIDQTHPFQSLMTTGSVFDLIRLLKLNFVSKWSAYDPIDTTARAILTQSRFSSKFIDTFFEPFLGGIFLDRSLDFSAVQFLKVWRYLHPQGACLLPQGIQQLPDYLSQQLAKRNSVRIQKDSKVDLIETVDGFVRVRAESGSYQARSVIWAAGYSGSIDRAVPVATYSNQGFKSSECLYFAADGPLVNSKHIVLNPTRGALVNQIAPLTNVAHSYAPPGKHLICATILGTQNAGDDELSKSVIAEIQKMGYDEPLEFRRRYTVHQAQLAQEPYFWKSTPPIETHLPGVFLAGEITTSSSINDALKSGRLAAEAALAYLRNK